MPNKQKISELVDEAAFKQLDLLEKSLEQNVKSFQEAAAAVKQYSDGIANVSSLQALTVKSQAAKKATDDLALSQDKIRLAEIELREARRKAFDDFEKRIQKQYANEQNSIKQETLSRNARIKNIDAYNAKLEKQALNEKKQAERKLAQDAKALKDETLQRNARIKNIDDYNKKLEKQTIAEKKAASAAEEANRPYAKLNVELNVLRQRAKDIGVEFGTTSKQFKDAAKEVNNLDSEIKKIDGKLGQRQKNVGNYPGDKIAGSVLAAGAALLSVDTAKKIVKDNAQIADSYSDVQRTANLTSGEVDKLDKSLRKIDTRTGLNDLIKISAIGGQLGIATKDLAGFTRAIDELAVTLSGEITGGSEAVATALGKINGAFKVQEKEGTNTETALNRTGSAILKLGQAGLATGGFLTDFALRTVGVANTAKLSLPTILGYSAVLEETGNTAEVAGTAFNKLVGSLSSKRGQFFKIAQLADSKLTLKEFTDLINNDANAALQKFFAGLNKGGKNLTSFTDLLDSLNLKGAASKNAIVSLAQNQELLNIRINEGAEAYKNGTLSAEQFALKNDNLAGSLAKIDNEITKISTGRGLARVFKEGADAILILLRETEKLVSSRSWRELFDRTFNAGGLLKLAGFNTQSVGENYDKLNNLDDTFSDNLGVLKSNNKKPGTKTEALRNFRETREAALSALTAYDRFNNAVKRGEIIDKGGAESKKFKTLADLLNQKAISLKEVYDKTKDIVKVDNSNVNIDGVLGKDKNSSKKAEAAEAKRIRLLSAGYASEQSLAVATLDAKYQAGKKDAEDTINFELAKLKTIEDTVNKRQLLYKKDSAEYNNLEKEKVSAQKNSSNNISQALKEQLSRDDQLEVEASKRRLAVISTGESEALGLLDEKLAAGLLTQEDYEEGRLNVMRKYGKAALDEELANVKKLIEVQKLRGIDTTDQEAKLAALKTKISKDTTDKQISDNKRFQDQIDAQYEQEKEIAEKRKELQKEVADLGISIVNGFFDNQKNKLEEQAEAIDVKKDQDIKDVEDSVGTEEQKAAKIAIINAKAQAQKDLIERKQRDLEVRKAKFEKAASIISIGITTAEAVAKITAGAAVLAATVPVIGVALAATALAQIPYVIGIGAAQIATILATPIPKFKDGGVMDHTGIAQFGEEGTELRINPDGTTEFTPDKTTLGIVEKGTRFISSPETKKVLSDRMFRHGMGENRSNVDLSPLLDSNDRNTNKLVGAINKNSSPGLMITKRGWFKTQRKMNSVNDYFNRNK